MTNNKKVSKVAPKVTEASKDSFEEPKELNKIDKAQANNTKYLNSRHNFVISFVANGETITDRCGADNGTSALTTIIARHKLTANQVQSAQIFSYDRNNKANNYIGDLLSSA